MTVDQRVTLRFHVRTDDAVSVVVTDPDGADIGDSVTVAAGLGRAWRPPVEGALLPCGWITPAGPEREFALPIEPAATGLPAGVYRVWFRLGVGSLNPLVMVPDPVVIFGAP